MCTDTDRNSHDAWYTRWRLTIQLTLKSVPAVNLIDITRLRQESELLSRSSSQHWSQSDSQSYASTTNIAADNNAANLQCSDSLSSTETLKWLGSMSDISTSSHATNDSHNSGNYYHFSLGIN